MTGNGRGPVYTVEARLSEGTPPSKVNGMVLDTNWRHVSFDRAPDGFGVQSRWLPPFAAESGFLTYEAAMALAWWFLASALSSFSVEMRLVEHEFTYSYAAERKTDGAPFSRRLGRIPSEE